VHATSDAAKGWSDLCAAAPGPANACFEQLRSDPRRRDERQHPLRHDLAQRIIGGVALAQWQYEVTGAGRVWYCIDDPKRTVWLTAASVGHPKATE
jgi:hypothetical protein